MKLARLLLHAFGPFSDTALDFTASAANLHLIYGPNEAGKSCALRAMTDLRFGIPLRSPDDFVHPSNQLRIGGVFIDDQGEPVGLTRRKGRGQTLSRFNVDTGQPDPAPVTHEDELRLSAGLERGEFEAMFGLNHARLREGGNVLLKGEGELGSALFEASAGTRGITALLAALDADAKQLYNPHGRAQHATINDARRQFDEQRHALREAQTRPADWAALHRAHEAAKATLDEVTTALENLRRRENELTELRSVEPLLREHDRTLAELESLADAPDLAENAREERLAAEQALRRAQQDLKDAELELTRCAEALSALVIEQPLLDHAEAVERLAVGIEAAARSRIEVQQQKAIITRIESDVAVMTARLAPGHKLGEILQALPSDADRVALNGHLLQVSRLGERIDGHRQRAEVLDEALKPDAEQVPALPDPAARQELVTALRDAQWLGDVDRQRADLERRIREFEGQLTQALLALGSASEPALRSAQPLPDAEISHTKQELAKVADELRDARNEEQRVERDLEEQRLRQRQLAAEGEVVTAETLRLARGRRDEGWALVRRAYVERSQDADELARSFDPGRALPEAFEATQSEADRQADLLRADANRAAIFAECSGRIADMQTRRGELDSAVKALTARDDTLRAAWLKRLAQAGLPSLDPDALHEWQVRRHNALQLAEQLAVMRADRDEALAESVRASSRVAAALRAVDQPVADDAAGDATALPSLIKQADRWEKLAARAEAEHAERAKVIQKQRAEREKVGGLIAATGAELTRHVTALQGWHARLFMPADSAPEAVKARLDELDGLARQSTALSDAQLRRAQHQAVVDDLAAQAAQLARLLDDPVPEAVDDFADRLRKRLAVSRQSNQERTALIRDQTRAQEKKRVAEAEQATQTSVQARLCAAAGTATIDKLPELEDAAARKRQAQKHLSALRQQLAKASARSEDELRKSLVGLDAIAIESERERCRAEITQREQDQASARGAEEQARRALEAIDASDRAAAAREAMESAAARFRAAVRPWARLRLAHALLQEALNRFRERAQAPMVAAASTYFSLMTGGRYERLVADEEGEQPVLRAQRSDAKRIGVEAMSDGTSDQLYLALRLAALDLRRASHPQMPLILDDVLITSDDERAANILRALARFAEGGQVMIFTHHRHLIDVARGVLNDRTLAVHSL